MEPPKGHAPFYLHYQCNTSLSMFWRQIGSWDGIRTHEALQRELMKLLVLSTYLPNHEKAE